MGISIKFVNRVVNPTKTFFFDLFHGHGLIGFNRFFASFFFGLRIGKRFKKNTQNLIYQYLVNSSSEIIEKFSQYTSNCEYDSRAHVWVLWMQGYDNAPVIVKKCIDSIRSSTSHPVIFLSKENLSEYYVFPEYIKEKYEKGIITNAQLSDIIRMAVLSKYGGLWVDSTIFIPKQIPEEVFYHEFFTCKREKILDGYLSDYRWTGFLNGCQKDCVFQKAVQELIFDYWAKNDYLIDYLLLDYYILIVYNEIKKAAVLLDSLPYNNIFIEELQNRMSEVFDQTDYLKLINDSDTSFFKLSWRMNFNKEKNGQKTYYGHLFC